MQQRAIGLALVVWLVGCAVLSPLTTWGAFRAAPRPDELRSLFLRLLGRSVGRDFPPPPNTKIRIMRFQTCYYYGNRDSQREFWYYPRSRFVIEQQAGRRVVPPDRAHLGNELRRLIGKPGSATFLPPPTLVSF